MVNESESLINVVKAEQAKVAEKREPKGMYSDNPLYSGVTRT